MLKEIGNLFEYIASQGYSGKYNVSPFLWLKSRYF